MSDPALQSVVAFVLELDRLKAVTRKTKPLHVDRYENPAEHSWQIALFALSLAPWATGPVDVDRVIRLLLVHDVGEIDTGDTLFYATDGAADGKVAERVAAERIFGLLPDGDGAAFVAAWQEFEDAATPEARFAHAVDRAMPVLLNLANRGQSWRENGVRYETVVARVAPPIRDGCPALWDWLEERLAAARDDGLFG